MKITKIKKLTNGKYKITLDDKSTFTTYDDVILNQNLLFSKKLDIKKLNELNKETKYYENYNKALKYTTIKMRSEKELTEWLQKNEIKESEITKIKKKLKELGFINDEQFCKAYINDRFHLNNCGPEKIKKELEEHHIKQTYIEKYLKELDQTEITQKLTKLIQKKIEHNHNYSNQMLKQKITNDLINQGYDKEEIQDIFNTLAQSDESQLEKEFQKQYQKLSKKYNQPQINYKIKEKLYQKGYTMDQINQMIEQNIW